MMSFESEMDIVNSHLNKAPVNVAEIIRQLGVSYNERPMADDASGRIDVIDGHYSITVNSNQSHQRKRFTAAHELAHYLLHRDLLNKRGHLDRLFSPSRPDGSNLSPAHEVEANKMAAQILMPKAAIEDSLVWKNYDVDAVAKDLQVSRSALEIRMKTLGLDAEEFRLRWERRDHFDDIPF
jgi:Zn-dependent peptidase ImmA (M78 family)